MFALRGTLNLLRLFTEAHEQNRSRPIWGYIVHSRRVMSGTERVRLRTLQTNSLSYFPRQEFLKSGVCHRFRLRHGQ